MNAKDFEKYAGKRTAGSVDGYSLEGGVVVGYLEMNDSWCLAIRTEKGGWNQSHYDVIIPDEKERSLYVSGCGKYSWGKPENVIIDEPSVIIDEPLDLTKILEGCEGVELWSDLCGKCTLDTIREDKYSIVVDADGIKAYFINDGRSEPYPNGKCLLWPSETNRDWSTFKKPVKIKNDDWVVCCDKNDTGGVIVQYGGINMSWKYIIPYDKFSINLTEEELKKLSII